jgi:L-ribulokinase
MAKYTIGLDYGTNSARALLVAVHDGREVATSVFQYPQGREGIFLSEDPCLARQHPLDYLQAAEVTLREVVEQAGKTEEDFDPADVIGIGVDTTGSTPMPVDSQGQALAAQQRFAGNLNAMAWLWKDHTSVEEAEEITELARKIRPEYLAKCGGTYSSEWFFAKILHCLRTDTEVFEAADTWVEIADWIPAVLCDSAARGDLVTGICAAGHKAMFNPAWGGYPDEEFLSRLDPRLGELRSRLSEKAFAVDTRAGTLSAGWAQKTGLREGTAVAVGAFDAHLGGVGAGIRPGTLVKIMGTSCCDLMVADPTNDVPDIPGLCGIVPGSILPGMIGLEAGQSAVGDLYNWFVNCIQPGGPQGGSHEALTQEASELAPGASGLLGLDWNNGNRCVLVDQRLTGLLIGQTLHTTGGEIYRALIESTAFGALRIIEQFEAHSVPVKQIVNCGGIAEKNPLVMQIYADVTGRDMMVSRSGQTCALGAAIAAAVAAGLDEGGYANFPDAQQAMTGLKPHVYQPDSKAHEVYRKLYGLYHQLHDAFAAGMPPQALGNVMKDLLAIRSRTRKG